MIKDPGAFKIIRLTALIFFISLTVNAQDKIRSYPSAQSLNFNDDAVQLADNLIQLTGATGYKANQISQVLVDYRDELIRVRNNDIMNGPDTNTSAAAAGGKTKADMMGILGYNIEQYYFGASLSLMSDFRYADYRADIRIKDILQDEQSKARYEQVKALWWKDVKDRVFPSITNNPAQPMR